MFDYLLPLISLLTLLFGPLHDPLRFLIDLHHILTVGAVRPRFDLLTGRASVTALDLAGSMVGGCHWQENLLHAACCMLHSSRCMRHATCIAAQSAYPFKCGAKSARRGRRQLWGAARQAMTLGAQPPC